MLLWNDHGGHKTPKWLNGLNASLLIHSGSASETSRHAAALRRDPIKGQPDSRGEMQPLCLAADPEPGLVDVLDRGGDHVIAHRIDEAPEAGGTVPADPRDAGGAQRHAEQIRHQRGQAILRQYRARGDRNVFFLQEDGPIRRSARILIDGIAGNTECYTAADLFDALRDEDAVVIAHVGGRYADIRTAHAPRLGRAVEVHSTWGTFEWLQHDAFDLGYRVGLVCHSDDHMGRPGAMRPSASHFGAIGGLTCYLMPELTREAVFHALRSRRH